MKKIIFAGLFGVFGYFSTSSVSAEETRICEDRSYMQCFTPAPYCNYPLKPHCICSQNGQCTWICG